ncbi:hypothetical protein SLS62_007674 [Diatrype stigma]|uniref:Major facilitator superfamily (MFS) profile domain-containing protein n=1 Tax=Diatrype stigma TaxID=117547 RepID=A0AAN9ULI0_9PEZI
MVDDPYATAPNTGSSGSELELQSNDAVKSSSATAEERVQSDDKKKLMNGPSLLTSTCWGRVGAIVIFAKLSGIFGRKTIYATTIAIFVVASAACGGAQTFVQLIIFRAFQGAGGGAAYSLSTVLLTDLVPSEKLASAIAQVTMGIPLSMLLGPIIGGAISGSPGTNWRWIFLINVPIGAAAFVALLCAMPSGFPYQQQTGRRHHKDIRAPTAYLARLDLLGSTLLLLATLSLTAGFEEADSRFAWNSAYVISLLVISVVLWAALMAWERRVTLANAIREPVLPWRFLTSRAMIGILA